MIAGRRGATEGGIRAAILRLLLAPSLACNLHIGAAQHEIESADGNPHIGGWNASDPLAGGVVVKLRGRPLAGGIVEHAFLGNGREGSHRVDGQGLPWLEAGNTVLAGVQLLGKYLWVGGGFEDLLCDFAGDLVLSVAVGDAADK